MFLSFTPKIIKQANKQKKNPIIINASVINGLKEFYQNKTFAIPGVLVSNFLLADVIKQLISI